MAAGAETVKKVFLELGGKSASIVLDDAKLEAVLPGASMVCMHGGQGCAITTRLLLPRKRYAEGLAILEAGLPRGEVRRSDRSEEHPGPADQPAPAGPRDRLHREGRAGRRARGGRRQAPRASAEGLLRRADAARRRAQRHDRRAGGDLRAGARRDPARRRRRRGAHRQRLALRLSGAVQSRPPRSARSRWRGACAPAPSASTAACGSRPTRRSAATSRAASAARWALEGFEEYLETKTIGLAGAEGVSLRRGLVADRPALLEPSRHGGRSAGHDGGQHAGQLVPDPGGVHAGRGRRAEPC